MNKKIPFSFIRYTFLSFGIIFSLACLCAVFAQKERTIDRGAREAYSSGGDEGPGGGPGGGHIVREEAKPDNDNDGSSGSAREPRTPDDKGRVDRSDKEADKSRDKESGHRPERETPDRAEKPRRELR